MKKFKLSWISNSKKTQTKKFLIKIIKKIKKDSLMILVVYALLISPINRNSVFAYDFDPNSNNSTKSIEFIIPGKEGTKVRTQDRLKYLVDLEERYWKVLAREKTKGPVRYFHKEIKDWQVKNEWQNIKDEFNAQIYLRPQPKYNGIFIYVCPSSNTLDGCQTYTYEAYEGTSTTRWRSGSYLYEIVINNSN